MIGAGLMRICKKWGEEDCHPDVSKWSRPQQLSYGEEIPIGPVGKEVEELDEKCKECGKYLEIEERKCPVCRNENLQFQSEDKLNAQPIYNYECMKCGTKSIFSFKKFH